jgi:Icc-related predicted phosphoesterase
MIIDAISDLHGHYPQLEGGDLLIIAGDLTKKDDFQENCEFKQWIYEQKYRKKIIIAGNHDNSLVKVPAEDLSFSSYNTKTGEQKSYASYLCDSGTEFEGLKIFGSPWTKSFEGMNPKAKAFTLDTEEELAEKWALIPSDVDILVTHSPPYGILDEVDIVTKWGTKQFHVGSSSLWHYLVQLSDDSSKQRILICGHIHESYGRMKISNMKWDKCNLTIINASHVNERYEPVNKPIRIIL